MPSLTIVSSRYILGITDTGESGPTNVRAIGEVVNQILGFGELLQIRWAPYTALQQGRSRHDVGGESVKNVGRKRKKGDLGV